MIRHYLSKLLTVVVLLTTTFTLTFAQTFEVTAPASVAGTYTVGNSVFGPQFDGFSGEVANVTDVDGATTACVAVDNAANDVTGKVALIDRGACAFSAKAISAQDAGAIAVIICNNDMENPDDVIALGGTDGCVLTIPTVMLSFNDCQAIRVETGVMVTYTAPDLPSAGEAFETAIDITDGTYTVDSITGTGGIFTGSTGAAWYTYVPAADGVLNITSCGSGADTRLIVGAGACAGDVGIIDFSIDDCDAASDLDVLVFAGLTYLLIWDDAQSADGFDFTVTLNPLPTVATTFTVNMELETVSADGVNMVYAAPGTTDIGDVNIEVMSDNGDGTWSATIMLTTLDTIGYAFVNGGIAVENVEAVPMECGADSGFGFNIRPYVQIDIDSSGLAPVCFGLCTNCPLIDVTVTVDMSNETVSADGVNLVYGLGMEDATTVAMTDNMDGTWSGVMSGLTTGDTLGYFFVNGANPLTDLESVPMECGVDSGLGFNVRPYLVEGFDDTSVDAVCFSGCGICPSLDCAEAPAVLDDMESYTLDFVSGQSAIFETWSGSGDGTAEDATVSDEQAASGTQSVKIEGNTGPMDVIALMGNQTDGKWLLKFKMYVPTGSNAYYNIQEDETPAVQWIIETEFTDGGTGAFLNGGPTETFTFPQDEWFDIVHLIDLDNDLMNLNIAGVNVLTNVVYGDGNPANKIGALNFFPLDNNLYYVDDIELRPLTPCEDGSIICESFEAYVEGDIDQQSGYWDQWPDFTTGSVTIEESFDGCQSYLTTDEDPDDALLRLGDRTEGRYSLTWQMLIPAGFSGYYNVQKFQDDPAGEFGMQMFFLDGGTGELDATADAVTTFDYPQDEWFEVAHIIDLDNDWMTLTINGVDVFAWPASAQTFMEGGTLQLGAINFFGNTGNRYYVDDISFRALPSIPGNLCGAANDISDLFGQAEGEPQTSGIWDNTNYEATALDPDFGWECFGEPQAGGAPSLERTIWYTFVGDGGTYDITTVPCNAENYIGFGDTQIAVYSGDDCTDLTAVACNEDDADADDFRAKVTIETEPGVTYYMMIDGFGPDFEQFGEYCVEVTNTMAATATVTFVVDMNLTTFTPGEVYLSGSFNGFPDPGAQMDDSDNDGVYVLEVPVQVNTNYEYKFQNGTPGGWEDVAMDWGGPCTADGFGNNRILEVGLENVVLDTVCFGFCVSCNAITDVTNQTLEQGVSVFPNPVQETLTVSFDLAESADRLNLRIVNVLGQVVYNNLLGNVQNEYTTIDVSNIPAGTYMVHITDGEAQFTKTIVIQ